MQKFGPLFSDLKSNNIYALRYMNVYFVRRYIIVAACLLRPDQINFLYFIQINLHLWSTGFKLCYLAWNRPFVKKLMNYQDIMNEAIVLICGYHMFVFTDWVDSDNTRFTMGYSLIGFIILNVIINLSILF